MQQLKAFILLSVLICVLVSVECKLALTAVNATLSLEETKAKLGPEYKARKTPVTVSCKLYDSNNAKLTDPSITWHKIGSPDSASPTVVRTLDSNLLSLEEKLTIKYPQHGNVSAYVCAGKSGSEAINATVAIESKPLIIISMSGSGARDNGFWTMTEHPDLVIQPDQPAIINCLVDAVPFSDEVQWLRVDAKGVETPAGNGSVIELASASYEKHRGHYLCRSKNSLGSNSFRIFLRVKSRHAFVLPLVILSVIVVITLVITVTYQLHMNKLRADREAEFAVEADTSVAT